MGGKIEKSKIYYIWVDTNIKNSENLEYYKYLSKTYNNLAIFTNIKDALKFLQSIKFCLTYFIVSGTLFPYYISELKNIENKISTSLKTIIFTSTSTKQIISNMKEINDSFYNIGGLVTSFEEVISFLNKNALNKELSLIQSLRREIVQTGGDFSFQLIENRNDLIGPVYLSDLIIKPYKLEYAIFDKYLINNYGDIMKELISQIYNVDCPVSLRIKYWLRAYTLETKFYNDLNFDLMKGKVKIYLPYIKLLYSGLENKFINVNVSNDLYRGGLINKKEIQNLINHKNKRKLSDLPNALIYCKSFMSFSLDKSVALQFMQSKNPTEKKIRVLYILKAESGLNIKNATHADLSGISYYENEREILLFPFSVYEISDFFDKNNYYEIYLNYLGKYKELFHFKNQTDLYNSIFNSKFIRELELVGLSSPIWLAKKSLCKIKVSGVDLYNMNLNYYSNIIGNINNNGCMNMNNMNSNLNMMMGPMNKNTMNNTNSHMNMMMDPMNMITMNKLMMMELMNMNNMNSYMNMMMDPMNMNNMNSYMNMMMDPMNMNNMNSHMNMMMDPMNMNMMDGLMNMNTMNNINENMNMNLMNNQIMHIGGNTPDDLNYIESSGFCCLIPLINKNKKIPVLITCIKKETLIAVKKLSIQYDNGYQEFLMYITDSSKIYSNDMYGITIIEMENYNENYNQLIFMDIDEDIFNSKDFIMENFNNKKAYILEYAKPQFSLEYYENNVNIIKKNIEEFTKDKQYTIEEGKIIIKNDKFYINHNIPTNYGASGGPIISHNKFKVIGYHMGRQSNCNTEYIGFGFLLTFPILDFIREYYS